MICLLPTLAFAKTYKAWDIYNNDLDMTGVVLKKGDKLAGASNVSVEITYKDSANVTVDEGNGTVKAVEINGEKVTEWVITDTRGSYISVGNWLQASVAFDLAPANGELYSPTPTPKPTPTPTAEPAAAIASFMVEDAYGAFVELTAENFEKLTNHNGRKIMFTGCASMAGAGSMVIPVADGMYVEIISGATFAAGDMVEGTGTINGCLEYEGGWLVVVSSDDVVDLDDVVRRPLQEGDKGEAVTEMKLRMQELGYFKAGASLSDEYNDTCVERVKQFQKKNGLEATGDADVETLTVLFSDTAVAK